MPLIFYTLVSTLADSFHAVRTVSSVRHNHFKLFFIVEPLNSCLLWVIRAAIPSKLLAEI